jgi:hypothetical protein
VTYKEVSRGPPASDESGDAGDAGEHEEEGERDDAATAQMKPDGSVVRLKSRKDGHTD